MADPLQKLFGSAARLKLLRLFLFNPRTFYTVPEASTRANVPERTVRTEAKLFWSTGLVRRAPTRKRSGARYGLNSNFEYVEAMQNLLINAPMRGAEIAERLRKVGAVKLVVVSGIFTGEWEGGVDLLIVGDRVQESKLRTSVRRLEADLGKELRYGFLTTNDFFYRMNMNDKLIKDVFDYQHTIVFDKLNIGLK